MKLIKKKKKIFEWTDEKEDITKLKSKIFAWVQSSWNSFTNIFRYVILKQKKIKLVSYLKLVYFLALL